MIDREIGDRNIKEVLHFTTNRGLVGMLASGSVLSRHRLPKADYLEQIWQANAAFRPEAAEGFDKSQNWLDYINLSISEINSRFLLVSRRWHAESHLWWVIMSFEPSIMAHDGVVFATTNNGYDRCVRASGPEGLQRLFAPVIQRKSPRWEVRRLAREPHLPTCEQAEVLYPSSLPLLHLKKIYVRDDDEAAIVAGWLVEFGYEAVSVDVVPTKFAGMPN